MYDIHEIAMKFSDKFKDKVLDGLVPMEKIKGKGKPRVLPVKLEIRWADREINLYNGCLEVAKISIPESFFDKNNDLILNLEEIYLPIRFE